VCTLVGAIIFTMVVEIFDKHFIFICSFSTERYEVMMSNIIHTGMSNSCIFCISCFCISGLTTTNIIIISVVCGGVLIMIVLAAVYDYVNGNCICQSDSGALVRLLFYIIRNGTADCIMDITK
jgi:hypothetical protein